MVTIKFASTATVEDSLDLQELKNLLEKELGKTVTDVVAPPQSGIKDGGVLLGLTIAGLAFTAIGTLIQVLSYWQSQKPKYMITMKRDDITIQISDLSQEEMEQRIAEFEEKNASSDILCEIYFSEI